MDIMSFLAKFASKQRLTVLGAISALIIGLTQYPDPPQAAVAPTQPEKQEEVFSVPAQGALPKGYNPNAVIRDPFAVPAEFRPQPAMTIPTGAGREKLQDKAKEPFPVVQGIVGAGSTKVAILSIGSDSRSYRVNERIGSYVITAISTSSVTLQGPDGSVVVPLGR